MCVCMPASQRFAGKVEPVKYSVKWADSFSRVPHNFYKNDRSQFCVLKFKTPHVYTGPKLV